MARPSGGVAMRLNRSGAQVTATERDTSEGDSIRPSPHMTAGAQQWKMPGKFPDGLT